MEVFEKDKMGGYKSKEYSRHVQSNHIVNWWLRSCEDDMSSFTCPQLVWPFCIVLNVDTVYNI